MHHFRKQMCFNYDTLYVLSYVCGHISFAPLLCEKQWQQKKQAAARADAAAARARTGSRSALAR
jgi:hypothetical protein